MIVKVQLPLNDDGEPLALIYDRGRTFEGLVPLNEGVLRVMNGRPKAFFKAKIVGKQIELLEEAPWQTW